MSHQDDFPRELLPLGEAFTTSSVDGCRPTVTIPGGHASQGILRAFQESFRVQRAWQRMLLVQEASSFTHRFHTMAGRVMPTIKLMRRGWDVLEPAPITRWDGFVDQPVEGISWRVTQMRIHKLVVPGGPTKEKVWYSGERWTSHGPPPKYLVDRTINRKSDKEKYRMGDYKEYAARWNKIARMDASYRLLRKNFIIQLMLLRQMSADARVFTDLYSHKTEGFKPISQDDASRLSEIPPFDEELSRVLNRNINSIQKAVNHGEFDLSGRCEDTVPGPSDDVSAPGEADPVFGIAG